MCLSIIVYSKMRKVGRKMLVSEQNSTICVRLDVYIKGRECLGWPNGLYIFCQHNVSLIIAFDFIFHIQLIIISLNYL